LYLFLICIELEHMSDQLIRASEIAEYVYCHRAWWLRRAAGYSSENVYELARGNVHHQGHGRLVQRSHWGQRLAIILLFIAVSLTVFAVLRGL
jgi:CRISPR/Cas system-associated exonuclease Cas4 (RecB family)